MGHLVSRKTTSAVALTKVKPEDRVKLQKMIEVVKASFNDKYDEITFPDFEHNNKMAKFTEYVNLHVGGEKVVC